MKGADVVMAGIVQYNDWLEEEVDFLLFHKTWLMCNNSDFISVWNDSQADRVCKPAESTCCWLCFLVRKHGKGRPEGPGGLQEVPDRGAVSRFWGKYLMRLTAIWGATIRPWKNTCTFISFMLDEATETDKLQKYQQGSSNYTHTDKHWMIF